MTLKTASRIETAIRAVVGIIFLPFNIIRLILLAIAWPFEKIIENNIYSVYGFCDWIGIKLQQNSDEVKNGEIQNPYMIRSYTARFMHKMWEEEKQNKS